MSKMTSGIVQRRWVYFRSPEFGVLQANEDLSNKKLMVFVHGFYGDCMSTWGDLPRLLLQDEDLSKVDFCFLGYKSTVADVPTLGRYLSHVFRKAADGQEPFPIKYQKFIVVAHSLGGAGVRASLVRLHEECPRVFLRIIACVFGAPAIFGSNLTNGKWRCRLFFEACALIKPVLNDLSCLNGNLEFLKAEYDRIKTKRPITDYRWALYERIVTNPPLDFSPSPPDSQATEPYSHCDLVKPSDNRHPFYKAVREAISRK